MLNKHLILKPIIGPTQRDTLKYQRGILPPFHGITFVRTAIDLQPLKETFALSWMKVNTAFSSITL